MKLFAADSFEDRQKLTLIWAQRRERLIAVRISYNSVQESGCTIYG